MIQIIILIQFLNGVHFFVTQQILELEYPMYTEEFLFLIYDSFKTILSKIRI